MIDVLPFQANKEDYHKQKNLSMVLGSNWFFFTNIRKKSCASDLDKNVFFLF